MQNLSIIEVILRNRTEFFREVSESIDLSKKIIAMLISSFVFLAIYGLVMGSSHSVLQAIASFFKVPLLFLTTLMICVPSLHYFNILFGSKQTILQTLAMILTAVSTTSVLLFSFAPITLFFLLTSSQYEFFKLLNVTVFAISGFLGVWFLRQGLNTLTGKDAEESVGKRRLIFTLWVILYAFVGSQMAWTLRPFMGEPGRPFYVLIQLGGNFYADVIQSIGKLIGLP
jgi:hypothetical protein